MKKKIISSVAALALCGSIVAGATYALFTSESKTNVAIQSGSVNLVASLQNLEIYSPVEIATDLTYDETQNGADVDNKLFANGGTAELTESSLKLNKMTPGDKASFEIMLDNQSDVAVKYQTTIQAVNDTGLFSGLTITVDEEAFNGRVVTPWSQLAASEQPAVPTISVSVELPVGAGNEYQGKKVELAVAVNAVQANAQTVEAWDGTVDEDDIKALEESTDDVAKKVDVSTPGVLAAFAAQVNSNARTANSYQGYTVTLTKDIDLGNYDWTPIYAWNGVLDGVTIDGNGHTISNMCVNGGKEAGFISTNASSLTIKNLTFDNVHVQAQAGNGTYAGVVMGKNYSSVTLENVDVKNSKVINNWQCGGLVGFAETNAPTFVDCDLENVFVGGKNATSGILFGLGAVDITATGCTAKNVRLYTDMPAGFVGYLYGKTFTGTDCTMENVTVVTDYDA